MALDDNAVNKDLNIHTLVTICPVIDVNGFNDIYYISKNF